MRLKLILAATAALVLAAPCFAAGATPPPFTEGKQYVAIASPQRFSNDGKVEVVEVFSYGCIHCAHFAPYMAKLRKELPKGVVVHLVPAAFNQMWVPYARAFYAAQELGVVKRTHEDAFKAKFSYNYPMNTLDDYADFYARHGVNRKAFLRAAKSKKTTRELIANTRLEQRWGVMGTPTIIVDGKYRSGHISSFKELVALTKWLVQRELNAKAEVKGH